MMLAHYVELRWDEHTVSGCWPASVHVCAKVRMSRCGKGRVCDALRVQAESNFLRIVLRNRQGSWYDLGHVSISPSCLILVWIIRAGWLQPLQVCKVEGLLRVRDERAFLKFRHDVSGDVSVSLECRRSDMYPNPNLYCITHISGGLALDLP
jgi:hypothetical protein